MHFTPQNPFRRLQWRITLRFVLTSVLTTLLVQTLYFALLTWLIVTDTGAVNDLQKIVEHETHSAIRFFPDSSSDTLDTEGIQEWLDALLESHSTDGVLRLNTGLATIVFNVPSPRRTTVAIADSEGIIRVTAPKNSGLRHGKPLPAFIKPKEMPLFETAKRGSIATAVIDGTLVAVAPFIRHRKIVGLVLVRSTSLYSGSDAAFYNLKIWQVFFSSIGFMLLLTALGAATAGGVVGYQVARSLTKRLHTISLAADSWAGGDLLTTAPEKPADEIGLLAARLNRMAQDLRQVITLRNAVAALEERQRIMRDLHDTVKQQAFAATLMIGSAKAHLQAGNLAVGEKALDEAALLSRQMQTDLGTILSHVRAGAETVLAKQLERIAADWTRRSPMVVAFDNRCSADELATVTRQIGEQVTRIAEEAVANSVKHSRGTHVEMVLKTEADRFCLSIHDNGTGFDTENGDTAPAKSGWGLVTMRERAVLLPDGDLQIVSKPGQGTCLTLRFRAVVQNDRKD